MRIAKENYFKTVINLPKKEIIIHDSLVIFLPTNDGLEAILKDHQNESFVLDVGLLGVVTNHTSMNKKFYYISSGCAYMLDNHLFINVLYCVTDADKDKIKEEYAASDSQTLKSMAEKMDEVLTFSLEEIVVY